MNASRRARIEFFAQHAGYCTPPGRMICAKSLADAEEWAKDHDVSVTWVYDDNADLSWADTEDLERIESGALEVLGCIVEWEDRRESLWGVVVAAGDAYCRVVAAELCSELMVGRGESMVAS